MVRRKLAVLVVVIASSALAACAEATGPEPVPQEIAAEGGCGAVVGGSATRC
ncbi:MAG: hypothetical protein ACREON_08605 [Gemmatimonadaceae bacterium]